MMEDVLGHAKEQREIVSGLVKFFVTYSDRKVLDSE